MSAIPFSSAAATSSAHACARHADVLGPRFCTDCRAPLCTACSRYRAHRTCPSCNVAAGRRASAFDVGWYVMLLVDGFVHALGTVKTRVLPFAVATAMLGLAGVVALAFMGQDLLAIAASDAAKGAIDGEAMALHAFTALSVVVLGGLWAQPALALPTVTPVSVARRLLRSVLGTAVPALLVTLLLLSGAFAVVVGEELDNVALIVAGMLFGGGVMFLASALSSTVLPIQAAFALRGRSTLAALKAPFAGGPVPLIAMTVTWLMLLSMLYSSLYALFVPVFLVGLWLPWLGALIGLIAATLALCLVLVLTAAYATGGLRFAEDRARDSRAASSSARHPRSPA